MALYVATSGKTAAGSATTKVAVQLATGAGVTCTVVGFDVSFDGTDSTKTPIRVAIVKPTAASTGGAAGTLNQVKGPTRTVQTTTRTNDTTAGASPTTLAAWEISPTAAFAYQFPLGREIDMAASTFLEFQIITVAGSGTPNYDVNVWVEE